MKKNIRTSKQVIKALSIGISASMLLSSQGAFAAEGDGALTNDVNDDNNATVAAPAEEKHSEVDTAQDAEVKASESIKDTDTAVEEAAEAVEELEKLTNDTEDKAVTPIQETVEDISANTAAAGNAVYEVKDDLADAEDAALVKEADIAVMNNAAVSANNVTDSIVGTQDVSGFNEIAEEAKTGITENIEEINEATTIASAKESLDEAEASEKEVTDAYENAKAEYEAAEAAYTAAEADLAKAQQAYTEALNNAKANANDADAKLEAAKAKAALLEEQLKAAEAELQKDAAYDILCQEEAIKTAKDNSETLDESKYADLFEDIMVSYYIPTIKEAKEGTTVTVKAKGDNANGYKYCEVSYEDVSGNTVTEYYDYELNADGTGLVITEKDIEVVTSMATEKKATETEAKADLDEATKDLDEGSVVSSSKSEVASYSAKATYVVYFQDKTGNINENFDTWVGAEFKKASEETIASEHEYGIFDKSEYELSQDGSITIRSYKTGWHGLDTDYNVSGQITVKYAKTDSKKCDYATFWTGIKDLFNGGKTKAQIEAAIKAQVEADGGIYLETQWLDGRLDDATVYYIPGNEVTAVGTYETAEAAEAAAKDAANNAAKASGGEGAYDAKTKTFDSANVTVTENYVYWYEYSGTKTTDGDSIDELTDTEFRSWLSDAQGKKTAYENLKSELTKAQAALNQAVTDVETLQNEIEKLLRAKDDLNSDGILDELKSSLDTAKEKLTGAKDDYEEVKDLAEEAREAYQEAVERLTPPAEEDEDDDDTPVTTETTPIATVVTAAPAAAPAAVRTVATAPVEEEVTIVEEETPLAETVEEEKTAEPEKVDEAVVIDDSETPLAPAVDEEAMSWWWILIVLALGTTGAELYRRHQVKKNAAKVEEDK